MMFSKCLSNEVIGDNIRVNYINPGLVLTRDWIKTATELTAGNGSTAEAYLDDIAKKNAPIGRFASPEELAQILRLYVLAALELLRGVHLLRGRRLTNIVA